MRLIGEAAFERGIGKLRTDCKTPARLGHATHQMKAIGTNTERSAKLPGKFPAAQVRNLLELGHGHPFTS
jgi:hypothetical protein